jgi:hypothetical protein
MVCFLGILLVVARQHEFQLHETLTLRKCLTCVHWQWQLRVQEALNLFVSVHLPSSNVSSFVWHDLCCPHFAIKNLRSLRASYRKQTTSFIKPHIQVVLQPSSYRVTFLGIGICFPKHVLSHHRLCASPSFSNSCVNSRNRSVIFTVSPCISIHYLYLFQLMHFLIQH